MRPSSQTPVGFEPTTFRKREDHSRPTATWSTIGQTCGHSGDRTRDLTHFQATALPFELRRQDMEIQWHHIVMPLHFHIFVLLLTIMVVVLMNFY